MPNESQIPIPPSDFIRIEAAALLDLALRLDTVMLAPFTAAVDLLIGAPPTHRVLLTGIGKSGIIARKIAATLRSTGTPAHFLHPAEAVHGDLGMVSPHDTLIALSYSGETEEILNLLPTLKRLPTTLIALCSSPHSTLAQAADVFLDVSVSIEACPLNLAPTASTTVMLALGDTLALELSRRRGFHAANFADLHPGGRLGIRLSRVRDLMHAGDALPQVAPDTPMSQVIYEMSRKKLGMTTVLDSTGDPGKLLGMISDGDLRRLLERDGNRALDHTAREIMNSAPITIDGSAFASTALAIMEERKITSLIVVDTNTHAQGVLHLHDLWIPPTT
ncbi:KpsF/GutQ family sugar-phosphate isomerase [Granulicella sp. dw_53]|uniref:KpsF/GutQ family sugar-phosphate isomerase n=1 Tax=Granulicella sp. dw_53 TaxID=2719792 RepID=UPI001BD1F061|nr:KpsF/GutQ family sugar-phosphate isomerase [Granulicella sp. dw_53]